MHAPETRADLPYVHFGTSVTPNRGAPRRIQYSGAQAAAVFVAVRASHRRDVWLGGDFDRFDSFPLTEGGKPG
jgi:hypothetical protein